jgi:competence protein ComEA
MTLYTRHQLLLVLLLAGAAGAGLAIDHWRRASPDLVERLERLDRVERAAAPETAREPRRAPGGPRARALREPRRETDTPDAPLDVNRAGAPELARLPGIGPTLAARIVQARPFTALEDLARVPGLRRATLARVRPLLMPWGRGTLGGFPSSPPGGRGTLGGFPSSPPGP